MSKYIEVTVTVPIKLFIKKETIKCEFGVIYGWSSTFGVGGISEIKTFSAITPEDAAAKMKDRLQGVLSG